MITAALLAAGLLLVQGPMPLIEHRFAEDAGTFLAIGPSAKIVVFHDPALKAPTTGALRFKYDIAKGAFNALILQASGDVLKNAKSIRFHVRADHNTLITLGLQEEEGGRYLAQVYAPKDEWQAVELSTSDFVLSVDGDSPKDPNGKLDLELCGGVFVTDFAQFFAGVEEPNLAALFNVQKGPHTMFLDDFTIGSDSVTPATTSSGDDVQIDNFGHPQLAWYGLGGMKLSRATSAPLNAPGFRADYRQATGTVAALTRNVGPRILTSTQAIGVDLASLHATKIIVQLEEVGGGKYNTTIDVPAGSKLQAFKLPYTSFKASDDSKDANGKLDVGEVKTITLLDFSGLTETASRDNTLWLTRLMALAKG